MNPITVGMPYTGQNMALAGKTVSIKGLNVTFNANGYAVRATNFSHKLFAGTKTSVRAPSIDAVLSGGNRGGYTGAAEDLAHFSDKELEHVELWRSQVADGTITAKQAYEYLEELRREYGYSLGPDGNTFTEIQYTKQPGEVLYEEKAAQTQQVAQTGQDTGTVWATSVQGGASGVTRVEPVRDDDVREQVRIRQEEQLRDDYQEKLRIQQEQQTIKSELDGMRADKLLRSYGEKKKDELFDTLFEDEEKTDGL